MHLWTIINLIIKFRNVQQQHKMDFFYQIKSSYYIFLQDDIGKSFLQQVVDKNVGNFHIAETTENTYNSKLSSQGLNTGRATPTSFQLLEGTFV